MRSENDNKYRRQMPRMEMHLHLTVEKYKLIGTDNIWYKRIWISKTALYLRNNWYRIANIKLCICKITGLHGLKEKKKESQFKKKKLPTKDEN